MEEVVEQGSSAANGNMRLKLILAAAGLALLIAAFLLWQHMRAVADISGVWRGQTSGLTYVIDRRDDGYRLSVGGHRLMVKSVQKDSMTGNLVLSVKTDSGLLALWSFKSGTGADGSPSLHLDQDGFSNEDLQLQRAITAVDHSRLAGLKIAKKPLWSPSFDCGKAGTDVERMICSDPAIASMDVQLAARMKALASDAAAGEAEKAWLHDVRDVCADSNCVHTAYQQRLSELGASSSAVAEAPPADADAGANNSSAVGDADATAGS